MAPAVLEHPEARPIRSDLMDKASVAYVLCRIEDDSSLTPVSWHGDVLTGIAAAGYAVEVEDYDFAYALYAGDPPTGCQRAWRPSARAGSATGSGRAGTHLGDIHAIDDRYDHDVDELMAKRPTSTGEIVGRAFPSHPARPSLRAP
jgi:hypothetical protein